MAFSEGVEEEIVVGGGLLDELNEEEHFRRVDDSVDSLLESLQRIERGEVEPE